MPAEQVEEIFEPYLGPDKSPEDVEGARAALQAAYEARGYPTVSVFIPEQSVDSGVIRLEVEAQTVGEVTIAGATRTSRDWVLARAPSLAPGSVPNFEAVQREVVALNSSADRKVTPEVRAGTAPGTIDVVLNVEDRSPLHASAELNNFSSVATTDLRYAGTLRHDDLWGLGHSFSISGQTAPRRTGDGTVLSANYLARLGGMQLLGYVVHSESDIAVIGGTSVVGRGDLGGLRLIAPLGSREGFYHSLTAGADYKSFGETLTLVGADAQSVPIDYGVASLAWRGGWTGERVSSDLALTATFGIPGIGTRGGISTDRTDNGQLGACERDIRFDCKRIGAEPDFFYLRAEGSMTYGLGRGLDLWMKTGGQWSPTVLISNEQFSIGGQESVRGYYESELLGDYAAFTQVELRSPELVSHLGAPVDSFRFHAFADHGWSRIYDPLIGQDEGGVLGSVGVGARIRLFSILNGAIDLAFPLRDTRDTTTGDPVAKFRIWGEF